MKQAHQTKHIRLILPGNSERTALAPPGFIWTPCPEHIEIDGQRYERVGAIEAYPVYRATSAPGANNGPEAPF